MLPVFHNTLDFARQQDEDDPLQDFRHRFLFPQHNDREVVYLTGNSLGLQPKSVRTALEQELSDWAMLGVEGHFHATNPWWKYHEPVQAPLARIVGAKPHEVVAMNGLTVNLHLLLATFYQPTEGRFKILCEAGAFPSDDYALETHVRMRGLKPEEVIVEVAPRDGRVLVLDRLPRDVEPAGDQAGDEGQQQAHGVGAGHAGILGPCRGPPRRGRPRRATAVQRFTLSLVSVLVSGA